jgi:hypothetical protein
MPCKQVAPTGDKRPPFRTGFATEAECNQACKEGACCEGTTCSVKPQCQCQGAGRVFRGVGTTCVTSDIVCCNRGSAGTATGTELCEPLSSACGCAAGSYQAAPGASCATNPCRKCKCTQRRNFPVSLSVTCRALFRGPATWNDSCGRPYLQDPTVIYTLPAVDKQFTQTLYLRAVSSISGSVCSQVQYRSINPAADGLAENSVNLTLAIEDFLPGNIGRCRVSGGFIYLGTAIRYDGSTTSATQGYGQPFGWNGLLGDDNFWDTLVGMVVPCGISLPIGSCWSPNVPTDESTITITSANYLP